MSNVAHFSMALVPPESNFEGLTKKLLALRAEIDAILTELASQATAMPQAAAMSGAEPERELLPVLSDPPADGESKREGWGMVEEAEAAFAPSAGESETGELLEPSQIVSAAAPEQPIADPVALEPIEAEQDARDCAEPASEHPTPIAAIDADPVDDASLLPEADVPPTADTSPAISATEAVSAEQQCEVAMLDAPRQEPASQVDGVPSAADGRQVGDGPVTLPAGAGKAVAEATVISLQARQRKHKGGLATGAPMSARSGRWLAAKIAACILVLLTAATVLVMADRTAFGSVQSLPWMSPTPSGPTGIEWLLQRLRAGVAQSDDAAARADLPPLDDGPLAGYPVAWGS